MYKPGDLETLDPACPDSVGNCDAWPEYGHQHMVNDSRGDGPAFYPCVYLPHSCQEWVIGGPEQIKALIYDLTAALQVFESETQPLDRK